MRSAVPHPSRLRAGGVRAAIALVSALSALAGLSPAALHAQDARVVITPSELTLEVGASRALVIEVRDADGRTIDAVVRWLAQSDIITVDDAGTVTANRPGDTRIAAVVNGEATFVPVRVPQLPAERLEIAIDGRLLAGTTAAVRVTGYTRLGDRLDRLSPTFRVSEPGVASMDASGRLLGVRPGETALTVTAGGAAETVAVRVEENPATAWDLRAIGATGALRTGDVVRFELVGTGGGEVRGVRPLWTSSPAGAVVEAEGDEGVFVAETPGTYQVTAVAGPAVARTVTLEVAPRVHTAHLERVGHGVTSTHRAGDTWVFEGSDGRDYAYLGTFYHDWMKVWDVTDPATPVLTDSLQLDARRINDVKIHPNGRLGIVTREGASSRRNGIVLLDLANPAHPTILSEYTETVTGGVHNVWILGDEDLVYACHNGTSDIRILDISDPSAPREVGRWGIENPNRTLHDVIVQDGYAYASYWDDGVYVLDVGAGTHGGTPTAPVFVSSYSYPEGHTHVAWRHGKYLFVGDEIYPSDWDPNVMGPIEARGYVHVLDMTDIENPVEVARYEVPEAGAHNLWSDDRDRLYIGYYQAGLRIVDISGELRGDLYRQGREIGAIKTASSDASVPNWSMTWGAQVFKGRIYSSDLFSGLWVTRLVERELVP